ncbi:unnamed protein product [Victoria cruziana]
MLDIALVYKDVFGRYLIEDPDFVWYFSSDDWEKIIAICGFLQVFQDVFVIFSCSNYFTSNLFFIEIWRVQDILQEKTINGDGFVKIMATKMKENFDKY